MTSSLHGDEVNGVRVIHRLFQTELDPESLHGTVVAVIVANIQGFLAGTRGMDGQDLNRLMPGYLITVLYTLYSCCLGRKMALHHSSMRIIFFIVSSSNFNG